MRWSEEQTVAFVKFYLQHEYLWNTKHDHYGQKYLRKKAYKNIASLFEAATGIHLIERDVMTKIKNLGSTYAQELTKIKKRSETDRPYRPAMKWFHYWYKCKRSIEPVSDDTDLDRTWLDVHSENENNDGHSSSVLPTDDDGEVSLKTELEEPQTHDPELDRVIQFHQTKSNKKRWSEDETVKFVRIYLQHKLLWNPKHTCYRNNKMRKKAFNKISSDFKEATGIELSEKEVVIKIKTLKSTYTQEQTKIKNKSTLDFTYVSKLKWIHEWDRIYSTRSSSNESQESDDQKVWLEIPMDYDDDDDEEIVENSNTLQGREETQVKSRWSETDTLTFVKIYLQYDFLYNPKHKYFRQKKLRQEGYSSVSSEFEAATGMKLDEKELKAKIKILGSTYAQELSKIKKRSGNDQPYSPTIKWFQYWHKYKYSMQQHNARNSTNDTHKADEEEDWTISNFEEDQKPESESEELSDTQDYDDEEFEVKKIMKTERTVKSENHSDRVFTSSITNSDCTREDEFEHYGRYIASVLRSMDSDKALQIELEIQNLLSAAQATNKSDNLSDEHIVNRI